MLVVVVDNLFSVIHATVADLDGKIETQSSYIFIYIYSTRIS